MKKLTEFDYHEALDRVSCIELMAHTLLVDHPVFKKETKLRNDLLGVLIDLNEVYQRLGEIRLTKNK